MHTQRTTDVKPVERTAHTDIRTDKESSSDILVPEAQLIVVD